MTMKIGLVLGDLLAIAVLTIVGFASHSETAPSFIPRMGTTFFPMLIGWFLLAPWFGLFDQETIANLKHLWRVVPAMTFAAPFASVVRAALLGTVALPLFTLILGTSFALGLVIWRALYTVVMRCSPK